MPPKRAARRPDDDDDDDDDVDDGDDDSEELVSQETLDDQTVLRSEGGELRTLNGEIESELPERLREESTRAKSIVG